MSPYHIGKFNIYKPFKKSLHFKNHCIFWKCLRKALGILNTCFIKFQDTEQMLLNGKYNKCCLLLKDNSIIKKDHTLKWKFWIPANIYVTAVSFVGKNRKQSYFKGENITKCHWMLSTWACVHSLFDILKWDLFKYFQPTDRIW